MAFTKKDYIAKMSVLRDMVEHAGKDHVADIEEGYATIQFYGVAADIEGKDACAHLMICEDQPEELLAGRPHTTLRRSNTYTIRSWDIYLFPDGEKMQCSEGTPECYKKAVETWLRVHIRNQAGGGSMDEDTASSDHNSLNA